MDYLCEEVVACGMEVEENSKDVVLPGDIHAEGCSLSTQTLFQREDSNKPNLFELLAQVQVKGPTGVQVAVGA